MLVNHGKEYKNIIMKFFEIYIIQAAPFILFNKEIKL
jgi:hypothetical protein